MQSNGSPPEHNHHRLNIRLSSGILSGDRIEPIYIPRDQDHSSFHIDRFLRRQLEIPPMPEFIAVTTVRMAIVTFAVSVVLEVSKSATNSTITLIFAAFALCILTLLWIYCARAIATQPQLKSGVAYLWMCIAFGAVFGILGGNYG